MSGKEHDLVELRERRNAAVTKGLRRMYKFFKQKNFEPLYDIGDDAPSIFFESLVHERKQLHSYGEQGDVQETAAKI